MAIEQDWQAFQRELPALLADESNRGKFVLIHGETVAGVYDSEQEGLAAGYERFGIEPFMVQEITDQIKPKYFSRNVTPCR